MEKTEMLNRLLRFRIFRDGITGSTNVEALKWDSVTKELVVQFSGGITYTYDNVPEAIYLNILDGQAGTKTAGPWGPVGKYPSVGAAVHQYLIEGGFVYRRGGSINFAKQVKIGFDWDDTLSTSSGQAMFNKFEHLGKDLYIISATQYPTPLKMYASRKGIPDDHIFIVKSNQQKINKVKELGLNEYYDNNPDVVKALPGIGRLFQ